MTLEFFGQFLVREDAITVAQLREALELMSHENLRLGQMAVEADLLSESAANEINREQRYSDKPFGAIAVEQGLLSEVQVRDLLRGQQQRRVRVGEALVRLEHLTPEALVELLRKFKKQEDRIKVDHYDLPDYLEKSRAAAYLLELTPRLALRGSQLKLKIPQHCTQATRRFGEVIASVLIRSEENLRVALVSDREFARKLTQNAFGQAPGHTYEDELLADGVGEFLNVLCGTVVAGLEQEGIPCEIDPPILGIPPMGGYEFKLVSTHGKASMVLAAP